MTNRIFSKQFLAEFDGNGRIAVR